MEQLKFDYPEAKRRVSKRAHVGVVGSGDMEILMEPSPTGRRPGFDSNERRRIQQELEGGAGPLFLET
jgi:hypothetical protein